MVTGSNSTVYECKKCQYVTHVKCNYTKHLLTKRHNNLPSCIQTHFPCEACSFTTHLKANFDRHCLTLKHITNITSVQSYIEPTDDDFTPDQLKQCLETGWKFCIVEMMKMHGMDSIDIKRMQNPVACYVIIDGVWSQKGIHFMWDLYKKYQDIMMNWVGSKESDLISRSTWSNYEQCVLYEPSTEDKKYSTKLTINNKISLSNSTMREIKREIIITCHK